MLPSSSVIPWASETLNSFAQHFSLWSLDWVTGLLVHKPAIIVSGSLVRAANPTASLLLWHLFRWRDTDNWCHYIGLPGNLLLVLYLIYDDVEYSSRNNLIHSSCERNSGAYCVTKHKPQHLHTYLGTLLWQQLVDVLIPHHVTACESHFYEHFQLVGQVIHNLQGWWFNPQVGLCHWARHYTPNCSWWAGQYLTGCSSSATISEYVHG